MGLQAPSGAKELCLPPRELAVSSMWLPRCPANPICAPRRLTAKAPAVRLTSSRGDEMVRIASDSSLGHCGLHSYLCAADDAVRYERELAEYERRNPGYCAWAAARRKGRKAWAASWPGAPAPAPTARQLFLRSRRGPDPGPTPTPTFP